MARVVEMTMRLRCGEALIPEMYGDGELCTKLFCEGLSLGRLWALVAGHVERVADDGLEDVMFAKDSGDGFEVGAAVGSMQCEERLRGESEWVREREADAPVAYVEANDSGWQIVLCGGPYFCWLVGNLCFIIHMPSVRKQQALLPML